MKKLSGYFMLAGIIIFICVLFAITIFSISKATIILFIIMLAVYLVLVFGIERLMHSFYEPTENLLFAKNYKIIDMKKEMVRFVLRAKRYIYIVAGSLREDIDASDEVIAAYEKVLEDPNLKIEIITEEKIDSKVKEKFNNWLKERRIIIYQLLDHNVSQHFAVIDDIDIRIEKKHKKKDKEIKAFYWYSHRKLGSQTREKFDEIKKKATLVLIE